MDHAAHEFKSCLEPEPRRLVELEEAVGFLHQVAELEGYCVAVFSWGKVSLPGELVGRLRTLQGRRVGILRYDGSYRLRIMEESDV